MSLATSIARTTSHTHSVRPRPSPGRSAAFSTIRLVALTPVCSRPCLSTSPGDAISSLAPVASLRHRTSSANAGKAPAASANSVTVSAASSRCCSCLGSPRTAWPSAAIAAWAASMPSASPLRTTS
eukprot:scaffold98682_cov66-Phaeocystis_antarctica.AAC.1